jgi:hypothetical protein
MRAESDAGGGRKMKMVFDGTAQVMRAIDDEAKTYTEMKHDGWSRTRAPIAAR